MSDDQNQDQNQETSVAMSDEPTESTTHVGAFALKHPLGRGGMGEVWRAEHFDSQTPAAIKLITADYAHDPKFQASFHREVQSMAMLDHPSVVRVFDYGEISAEEASASDGSLSTVSLTPPAFCRVSRTVVLPSPFLKVT